MKDKKTLKIASIIVAVLIAIFCITKILAAGIVFEDEEEWISTEWGFYVATEEGETLYSKESFVSGTYVNEAEIKNELENNGFYHKTDIESSPNSEYYNPSVFCIYQGQQLPSEGDENPTDTIEREDATYTLSADEKKALERSTSLQFEKAVKGRYNEFSGTYKTREFKRDENGKIIGTITKYATPNDKDGVITFLGDGSKADVKDAVPISWAEAFVFANNDPNENQEKTPAQLALWALAGVPIPEGGEGDRLNEGTAGSCNNDIYENAVAFEAYKADQAERGEGPKLVDADQDYKYRFNVQGNYLIAGPVKIDYGDLKYGDAELEVRQIEKFTVWGTLADSDELEDITEYVEFTDEFGNPLSNMETTSGTEDGDGAGKSFPASNEDFYIKVNYNSPIYTEVVAINSLEASFKELDVRAVGYKISDVKVCEVQWEANNVIWQECKETHNFTRQEWNPYQNYNPYQTFLGFDIYGNPQYQGGYEGGYDNVPDSTTRTNSNHLKENCNSRPTCTMGHTNCRVTITHTDIKTSPSFGVLLRGKPVDAGDAQNLFLLQKAELYWRRYKLVVLFGPENQNPPDDLTPPPYTPPATESPEIPHRTYIDIGGNVWVDAEETKEGTGTDGKYTEGSADYPRPNVKVTLYFEDGTIVNERDVAEWARKDFENPTYTDENGNYMFYQLPMDKKYYVEFTYDGMMYTTVDFLATDGDASKYKDSPNDEVYKTNSKAEEQEKDRTTFNNKFAEIIGRGPSSYSGDKTTGETGTRVTLEYKTKKFSENLQSRLRTTDEEKDVEEDHATGKAKEDFEMTVRTSDKQLIYPFEEKEYTIWDVNNPNPTELEYLKHINLGLKRRPTADFRLAVDLKAGATTIKDKEKVVFYKPSAKLDDLKQDATNLEDEYIKQEISASDYNWKAKFTQIYGDDGQQVTGYVDDDQLNVYVLYKIVVANQCELDEQQGVITGIVDYFDDRLTTVPQKDASKVSKLFNVTGFTVPEGATSWIEGDNTPVKWKDSENSTLGYNAIETDGLNLKLEKSGDTKAIYLILKVKNNGDVLYNGVEDNTDNKKGIENIAEIKSYKVLDENGYAAGLVDCDSAPYNATPGNKDTYEDDTDNAPMFQLILNWEPRKISGNVWDDAVVANAIRNGETGINKVKVELIEYCYNSETQDFKEVPRPGLLITNYELSVDKDNIIRTGNKDKNWDDGYYEFYVEGGNYAVKFIYGDTEMLKDPSTKQYNAQDYFAAQPYSALSDMEQYKKDWSRAFATKDALREYLKGDQKLLVGDPNDGISATQQDPQTSNRMDPTSIAQAEFETKWEQNTSNDESNARDNSTIRADVIRNAVDITNKKATLLNKLNKDAELTLKDAEELSGKDKTEGLLNYTYMEAMSDIVIVASNDLVKTDKVINLGLQERPKASMNLKKEVTKIVIKTNDGTELINTDDASKLSNLQKLDGIQSVFMNMDTKSMEGATIDIDYKITVENDSKDKNGEYKDDVLQNYVYVQEDEAIMDNLANELNEKYFKEPEGLTRNSKLPIRANSIYDYVNINLEYRADDNKDNDGDALWKIIYDNNSNTTGSLSEEMVISKVTERIKKENRVVSKVLETEDKANKNLKAGKNYEIPIHLGITLSEDIEGDNQEAFVYSNCAEIIQIYSGAGRRDEEIIPGNYVPYTDPEDGEPDASLTGSSVITPPLGENRIYYVITIISATIVIAGIVLIKKKVLKK